MISALAFFPTKCPGKINFITQWPRGKTGSAKLGVKWRKNQQRKSASPLTLWPAT